MSDTRHSLRLAFYGDDFTGSTDALEVLAFAGMQTALLLMPPTPEVLAHFPKLDAVGVAGDSRAMTPAEMDAHLPQVFAALAGCGAPIVHYKVCSTFDSSPGIGSIGRTMEIAQPIFRNSFIPVVGSTPALQYAVNPEWRGMTPYIAYTAGQGDAKFVLGEPKEAVLAEWLRAPK